MAASSKLALVPLLVTACVFPSHDPTGIELSWRFFEANMTDGEDGVRVRSCDAAGVDRVAADITDQGDESRQGIFRFECEAGYQTLTQFQTEASDAFVQLQPGKYRVRLSATDPGDLSAQSELLEVRSIEVPEKNITTEPWDLARAPVDWTLQLTSAETCSEVRMTLLYDDPAAQLPELTSEEEKNPVVYRRSLGSSLGILLDGTPAPCGDALNGAHVFPDVDRGAYVLQVVRDGFTCAIRVGIGAAPEPLPVDLANLPCGG